MSDVTVISETALVSNGYRHARQLLSHNSVIGRFSPASQCELAMFPCLLNSDASSPLLIHLTGAGVSWCLCHRQHFCVLRLLEPIT